MYAFLANTNTIMSGLDLTDDQDDAKKKPSKGSCYVMVFAVVCFCIAITVGLLLHFLLPKEAILVKRAKNETWADCHPEKGDDKAKCEARG